MRFIKFDNKKVYYQESGKGRPLLLLHGNTASSNMYTEIMNLYKNDFKVILIDFLGHGKSDRLEEFPADLWYYEAQQVIALLQETQTEKAYLIGSSGGALAAVNVALEAPELVEKVIADSFEGEKPLELVYKGIRADREQSKQDENTRSFYASMHGGDWEQVIDNDTDAIARHGVAVGRFFHKDISTLKTEILLTGCKKDEFVSLLSPDYFETVYGDMLRRIRHGRMYLFETGGHPAMLSNQKDFYYLSRSFLLGE